MNETDVAGFEPAPTLVKSPSTHGLSPAGVMPISQTSCNARKPQVPSFSSTNYSPNSPSTSTSSSRVAKTNKAKRYGGPTPPPSSLATRAPEKKRQRTTDAAAVTSTIASPTAAADDLGAFRHQVPRHQASETTWGHHPFLPGPPSHGEESDTNTGTQGPDLYYFPCSDPAFDLNSLTFPPTFHTPESLFTSPATHDNLPLLTNYPTDFPPAYTTHPFSYPFGYTLYPPPDPVNASTMVVRTDVTPIGGQLPHESDASSSVKRESSSGNERIDEWQDVAGNAASKDEEVPVENGNLGNYDGAQQDDRPSGDSETFLDETGERWEHVIPHIKYGVPTDDNRPPSAAEKPSKRSCLDVDARRMTAKTRKLKACIRCRMQKIKCVPDPDDEGQDCLTCRKINLDSKKVIHRLQCLRWKLAEVVLFREGGLELTRRWSGVKVKDLGPRDWANDRIRTIKVTIGYRGNPLELTVRKFKPNQTDVTWKNWVDRTGTKRKFNIEPYALASTQSTSKEYQQYIFQHAWAAVSEYSDNPRVHPVVRETYKASGEDVKPVEFLWQYIQLWFATRNTLGSAFIVGDDKLDMRPVDDPECPYYNTISIPRMIPAQFDSLGYVDILAPKRKLVLEGLWKMMASKNPHHFFTIYLTVFMLLHEVSVTSADRMRRARDNKYLEYRYDLASFVERLQEGANIILSHWHYYKRNVNDWMMEGGSKDKDEQKNVVWGELDPDEVQLLVRTRRAYDAREAETRRLGPMTWEDDLYFVSQMFEEGWHPKATFNR
ncbi:hypothetical protein F4821DRAFT_274478 [Hypoxylon rubiginosum]|uniref:Uncharacterized protein n=1 Tax=Hypoxylon rubiginosum TaxID=110542 RepID=A0ACC0CNF3_9PEZI|nr:hypothetical protein F4821DRAFT_274478 [Hypoxylon rubiginosum]